MAHSDRRPLTEGEITLASAAFGEGIDYERVRLVDGPGRNPLAFLAFTNGNPAIAIGSTVYFGLGYCPDFSAPGRDRKGFIHEMAHLWQYRALGMPAFFLRYALETFRSWGRIQDMYAYAPGSARFCEAMLEAQAEMVCDYGEAIWTGNAPRAALLARSLRGSGLYGL